VIFRHVPDDHADDEYAESAISHIDHLFRQGYISFSNSEQLLVVPEVRTNLLDKSPSAVPHQ
jgi:hypothetical protein